MEPLNFEKHVTYKKGINPVANFVNSDVTNLLCEMRERVFLLRQTNVSPRVFNLWKKIGLIDLPCSAAGREWIKLSFVDYLWLKIILDLRKFGCSLENINEVKKVCLKDFETELFEKINEESVHELLIQSIFPDFNSAKEEDLKEVRAALKAMNISELINKTLGKPMTMLEMAVVNMILTKSAAQIMITPYENTLFNEISGDNGDELYINKEAKMNKTTLATFLYTDEINKMSIPEGINEKWLFDLPHICLPLKNYLTDFIRESSNEKYLLKYELLSENELKLLKEIRNGKAHEIVVKLKDGTINRLLVKSIMNKSEQARVIETFGKDEYAEISYSVENGQIVRFEKMKKIRLNKE